MVVSDSVGRQDSVLKIEHERPSSHSHRMRSEHVAYDATLCSLGNPEWRRSRIERRVIATPVARCSPRAG